MRKKRKPKKLWTYQNRKKLIPLIGLTGIAAYFAGAKSGWRTQADFAREARESKK